MRALVLLSGDGDLVSGSFIYDEVAGPLSKLFWLFAGAMASGKTYSEHLKASQNLAPPHPSLLCVWGERKREKERERQEGGRVIPIAGKHSDWFCFAVRGGTMPSQDAGLGALFRGGALSLPCSPERKKDEDRKRRKKQQKEKGETKKERLRLSESTEEGSGRERERYAKLRDCIT